MCIISINVVYMLANSGHLEGAPLGPRHPAVTYVICYSSPAIQSDS